MKYLLQLQGEFDLNERDRLTDAFSDCRFAAVVIVDLSRATYIDSTVLNCLIVLDRATKLRNASVIVVAPTPATRRLFALTNLDRCFDIRPSLEEVDGIDPSRLHCLTLIAQ